LKRVVQRSVWGAKVIYFDYDSFVIKAESRTLLEAHARQYGLTRIAAFQLKAMLTNEVAASTALLWAKSVPKPFARLWDCWVCRIPNLNLLVLARKSRRRLGMTKQPGPRTDALKLLTVENGVLTAKGEGQ
jgi:hypothetical protein